MAMGKAFRIYEKLKPPNPHSIILEHRNNSQTLIFESDAVAVLSKFIVSIKLYFISFIRIFNYYYYFEFYMYYLYCL
jgi:hypothetical protein